MILKAIVVADKLHNGQFRKYGHADRPYIFHPMRVAGLVALYGNDENIPRTAGVLLEDMVAAAWLHDVCEDCHIESSELFWTYGFPNSVAYICEALTKPAVKGSREVRKAAQVSKVAASTWEAKVIKLCDRMDNLMELLDDAQTDSDFAVLYAGESRKLLDVLKGTHPRLEGDLLKVIDKVEHTYDPSLQDPDYGEDHHDKEEN